jgi:WD40 repeat protein/serine/threonine protein kinase
MNDESIFAAALSKAPGVERRAFLDGACGSDHDLRRRIERLLEADGQTGGILERGPDAGTTDAPGPDGPPLLAERVFAGRFKLRQKLGEGGMGEVWVADQVEPVQRRAAIKVVRPGLDSERMLARFEQERQALALMDHPNIAKVLDAGEAEGRPYFVMELIKGVPITEYCDRAKLSPRERLALFVPVCAAVQHAHQKGVVHRDLKPSNILVALYDGRPVPKVIDFGIAKATGPRLTDRSIYTEVGALIGTLEYMAPEQAELNNLDIDTRADVYALGAILCELLTGSVPFSRQELQAAGFLEMLRVIREVEPPRPSTKLSKSGMLPSVADVRRTDPQKLVSLMRGELDWIILKCLDKDRGRRYQAASGLARDLEHYLADEPVDACPPSSSYRLRKFARKHRKALVTTAAFAGLLVAAVVMSTLLAVWAKSAEKVANQERLAALVAKRQALEAKTAADTQRDDARVAAYASGMGLAQRAWEENNVVRARELLEEVPSEAAGRNLRGFEWFYLSRLCRADERNLVSDAGRADSLAFSPDGQRLASASRDYTVKIWDTATGKELVALKDPAGDKAGVDHESFAGWGNSVAFSPDGQRLASASFGKTVNIWDSMTGKELFALKGHAGLVQGVAFSPDGRRLASASDDQTVKIWDSATGKELFDLKGHAGGVRTVVFSPDGQRLASASMDKDQAVKIWDSATGAELFALKGHARGANSVAFSPDGQRLASASFDQTVKIWDSATGRELFTLKGHAGVVASVAFSLDGQRLASAGFDQTVKIWDSATGRELFAHKGHTGWVTSVAFSPDPGAPGRLASASHDRAVKIWDSATDKKLFALKGHAGWGNSVAFSPDGQRLASGRSNNTVKIWDSATGKKLFDLNGHAGGVSSVAFSPDGRRLASASGDQTVKIWDCANGKELLALKGHSRLFASVAFTPDGQRLASASDDQRVKIWDSTTGKELFALKGHAGPVWCVAFSPDGQRLASGSNDKTVLVWESATGKEHLALKGHTGGVRSVAFSPDGQRLASAGDDQTVKIWDSATGRELFALKGHAGLITSVAFSPDGQRLASAGHYDQTVRIWDSATGKEVLALKGRAGFVQSVAFSPDGQRLASANGDGPIHLWETTSVSREIQHGRETNQMVAELFGQMHLRVNVLERLKTLPGMSASRREEAIIVAETCPEDSSALDALAWGLVKLPGGEMSGYRKAQRFSEEACQLEPKNGNLLTTLGVAYYRVGNYEKALDVLWRSDKMSALKDNRFRPTDLAFFAMAHQQLGNAKEAKAKLQLLRERMKDPRFAQDAEAQGFLREAEELLAKPKAPGSK